jgi:outer membrane protein
MKLLAALALAVLPCAALAEERILTIQEAVETALKNNPQIVAARETRDAAGYRVYEARSTFMPWATATLSYSRASNNTPALPSSSSFDPSTITDPAMREAVTAIMNSLSGGGAYNSSASYNNYSASLSVTQTIWDFGKSMGAYDSARAGERGAAADLATSEETVRFTVIQTYFTVLAMQDSVKAAGEVKTQMAKHLELAQAQVGAGVRPKIDVTRAQSDLASSELTLLQVQNGLKTSKVTLCTNMGLSNCGEISAVKPEKFPDVSVAGTDEAVKEALEKRPEYRSLREAVAALEGSLTAAKSAYYPSLTASGNLNYAGKYFDGMAYNWSVGAAATWNFFSGLNTLNSAQEARARIRSAQASLLNLELAIRLEVESALLALNEARQKLVPSRAMYDSAKETLEMAEGRYAAGAGSIVEVTDAQATYTQAYTSLIKSEFDQEVAVAKVLKSLGRLAKEKR